MRNISVITLALSLVLSAPASASATEPNLSANPSGLPIPRFVSLKSDEVNVRSGPGTRYPIQWVYRREDWPVEIIEEFDQWRKIQDMEGAVGWVHKSMLDGRRTALITGKEAKVMRSDPQDDAAPVLKVAPKVLVKLAECGKSWCKIQVDGRKGWVKKNVLWGVYPTEVVQ